MKLYSVLVSDTYLCGLLSFFPTTHPILYYLVSPLLENSVCPWLPHHTTLLSSRMALVPSTYSLTIITVRPACTHHSAPRTITVIPSPTLRPDFCNTLYGCPPYGPHNPPYGLSTPISTFCTTTKTPYSPHLVYSVPIWHSYSKFQLFHAILQNLERVLGLLRTVA